MKYIKFGDIPQFTRNASYHVNMDIRRVPMWIEENIKEGNLQQTILIVVIQSK